MIVCELCRVSGYFDCKMNRKWNRKFKLKTTTTTNTTDSFWIENLEEEHNKYTFIMVTTLPHRIIIHNIYSKSFTQLIFTLSKANMFTMFVCHRPSGKLTKPKISFQNAVRSLTDQEYCKLVFAYICNANV